MFVHDQKTSKPLLYGKTRQTRVRQTKQNRPDGSVLVVHDQGAIEVFVKHHAMFHAFLNAVQKPNISISRDYRAKGKWNADFEKVLVFYVIAGLS